MRLSVDLAINVPRGIQYLANGFAERTLDAGLASWAERHVQLPHVDMEIDRPRVRPLETLRKSYVARNCRVEQATV